MKIKSNFLGRVAVFSATIVFAFTSCDKDESTVEESTTSNYAMFIVTDRSTMSGMLAPFDSFPSGEINVSDLSNITQLASTRSTGFAYGDAIYHVTSTAGDAGIQKLEKDYTGQYTSSGFIAGADIFGIVSETKGYYGNATLSQTALQIFNPTTMERTGEIDLSDEINKYKTDDVVSTYTGGFMLYRDGKFFTQVYFMDAYDYSVYDSSFVAVVDVETNTLGKFIIWPDFFRMGYYNNINCNYAYIDNNNDIYLSSFYGNQTDEEVVNYRVVRINSGETDFDRTWDLDAMRDISSGENFGLGCVPYNGKIYTKMFSETIDETFAGMTTKTYCAYEIDMETKEATKIEGVPDSYWLSINGPQVFDDKVFFIAEPEDDGTAYYYTYDPETKEVEKALTLIGGEPHFLVSTTE